MIPEIGVSQLLKKGSKRLFFRLKSKKTSKLSKLLLIRGHIGVKSDNDKERRNNVKKGPHRPANCSKKVQPIYIKNS